MPSFFSGMGRFDPGDTLLVALAEKSSTELCELEKDESGDCKWKEPVTIPIEAQLVSALESPLDSNKTQIRLFVTTGVNDSVREIYRDSRLKVPGLFFEYHKLDKPHGFVHPELLENAFFAKWSRPALQRTALWSIEQRISKGTPYSIDAVADPQELSLDHDRYRRYPTQCRPYSPIRQLDEGALVHMAGTAVSCFWRKFDSGYLALIVLDPPPKLEITEYRYKLWGKGLQRKSRQLFTFLKSKNEIRPSLSRVGTESKSSSALNLGRELSRVMTVIIIQDINTVLNHLDIAIDDIEMSLSDDEKLSLSLQTWRIRFSHWRQHLSRENECLKNLAKRFGLSLNRPGDGQHNGAASGPEDALNNEIRNTIRQSYDDLQDARKRLDSTFQNLMSTMSIVESRKAIQEAETVSKLTKLAFFFIPLTFVASIFGMNIIEFDHELKVWLWVVISIGVTTSSYIFLLWSNIATFLRHVPTFLQNLNPSRVSALSALWALTLYYFVRTPLGILAVGAVVTVICDGAFYASHLSRKSKIIAVIVIAAVEIPVIMVAVFLSRRSQRFRKKDTVPQPEPSGSEPRTE